MNEQFNEARLRWLQSEAGRVVTSTYAKIDAIGAAFYAGWKSREEALVPIPPVSRANEVQHGGDHYKQLAFQPWDVITAWGLGFLDGNAVKYLARWQHKNGAEDIKKAIHYLEKLLETLEAKS